MAKTNLSACFLPVNQGPWIRELKKAKKSCATLIIYNLIFAASKASTMEPFIISLLVPSRLYSSQRPRVFITLFVYSMYYKSDMQPLILHCGEALS